MNTISKVESVHNDFPVSKPGESKSSSPAEKHVAKEQKNVSADDVKQTVSDLNSLINTDLKFSIHEKTNQLMVQVVDTKKNKVLKEFPPHEFLDMVAKIRDYVGFLLDKKA